MPPLHRRGDVVVNLLEPRFRFVSPRLLAFLVQSSLTITQERKLSVVPSQGSPTNPRVLPKLKRPHGFKQARRSSKAAPRSTHLADPIMPIILTIRPRRAYASTTR